MHRWEDLLAAEDFEDEDDAHDGVPNEHDHEASGSFGESEGGEAPVGTLRFYLEHLDDPIHPGASVTLLQHCYIRMLEKLRAKTKDNYFDRDCRILKTAAGEGEGNLHPPTLGMVRKILGTREAQQCERHVCPCDQHVYAFVEAGGYREHREDACPECETPRFDQVRRPRKRQLRFAPNKSLCSAICAPGQDDTGVEPLKALGIDLHAQVRRSRGIVYKPKKRFWYFGLGDVVRDRMFTDPVWCKLRGTARPADAHDAMPPEMPEDFWHSSEFQRLDDATGNILTDPAKSASVYDIGIDWGQPFHFRQWSSGFIALRRVSLTARHDICELTCRR